MNVQQKRKKIFGKEFVFTVQDEELKDPIYSVYCARRGTQRSHLQTD